MHLAIAVATYVPSGTRTCTMSEHWCGRMVAGPITSAARGGTLELPCIAHDRMQRTALHTHLDCSFQLLPAHIRQAKVRHAVS